nr:MAG: hypothetical protein H4Bulk465452_000004 [Cystoviridae sp.]
MGGRERREDARDQGAASQRRILEHRGEIRRRYRNEPRWSLSLLWRLENSREKSRRLIGLLLSQGKFTEAIHIGSEIGQIDVALNYLRFRIRHKGHSKHGR